MLAFGIIMPTCTQMYMTCKSYIKKRKKKNCYDSLGRLSNQYSRESKIDKFRSLEW